MRMAGHSPIASLLFLHDQKPLKNGVITRQFQERFVHHQKCILNQAVYSQIPYIKVMLICNACLLLGGFCLVISELPEQALAQRTHSPGCFGTTHL